MLAFIFYEGDRAKTQGGQLGEVVERHDGTKAKVLVDDALYLCEADADKLTYASWFFQNELTPEIVRKEDFNDV